MGTAAGLSDMEKLGKNLFFDKISDPDSMSCAECHAPEVGFTGPLPSINKFGAVYMGAVPQRFGNRKPPSAAYAGDSPSLSHTAPYSGGMFWDGRATGWELGDPLAEQAMGPFLNPLEQNNPSKEAVCLQVKASKYAVLFEIVWGTESLDCNEGIDDTYEKIAMSIAAYERSSEVSAFSSKFDDYYSDLTEQESLGLDLFNAPNDNDGIKEEGEGGNCASCHPSEAGPNSALFTDFTYDNLGVPRNPDNPFYSMPLLYNPDGKEWIDLGLGGFLASIGQEMASEENGKHKVPTLRNVDKRPGKGFTKAYGHNGYFKSLKSIVHFYNTRDVLDECTDRFTTEKYALKNNCWPEPEVPQNVNTDELGNLGLTSDDEDAIVAFLKTLSDGYKP